MDFFKKVFKKKASVGHKLSDFDQNYFVGKVLGKGGFAVVKEVIRKSDSTKYAAKIIDKSRIKSEEENIKSEIEVLKKIKHQHIISMVDIYQTNTQYYLVMDLATGGELFDRIFALGQYTEKDASRVIHQLLLALEYLHDEVNIVHRDLKPENLLYKDPAADADILLTDFGLSRVVGTAEFLQSSCGTPHYVAPEVLQESGHGKPVDMWATGVICYILLCGYTPFWGGEDNKQEILFKAVVAGEYEFEEEYWSMISPQAKDFISKLLIVNPANRMTAKQALKHEWLKTTQDFNLLPNVRKNFNARRTFKKAVLAAMAAKQMKSPKSASPLSPAAPPAVTTEATAAETPKE